MNQVKFYQYTIGALLLLNAIILGFFLSNNSRPPHPLRNNPFHQEVVELLKLTEEQAISFKKMAKEHKINIAEVTNQQQQLLLPYFQSISNSDVQIDESETLNQIELLERKKIAITHRHLQEIKSILTTEQHANFKEFMQVFIEKVVLNQKKDPPPPKDLK
tara:strand:+ start:5565 stop:6047 length:483 start_codon:yes stop_codon:yes gene_type:complete